ncbi:hypothetical protein J7E81_02490 [Bacillus sp. ISL-18]|uniref:hypothetical protein n=1 Tax=Bacillus sp. ISL-18 TaxID=2819118 RepID=UPI001BE85B5A|nr:hypothetical protein [Bacillus sp. ISL-18]MBT2654113.1 hypothetical protein [Bacillus sp. ISL-18]
MADRKESEKDLSKQVENREENPEVMKQPIGEDAVKKDESEEQFSSLDLLWHHAFGELDEWAKRANQRDGLFFKAAKQFADGVQRNQGNLIELASRFYQEFSAWEKTAREEFLMSTTSLQHFFPLRSYEDINAQIDQVQEKTLNILAAPCERLASTLSMDKYIEMIEKYIALRKRGREQYIKTVKQAGNLIYENQKNFVNLFARQIKTLMFPLSKYLEKSDEFIK